MAKKKEPQRDACYKYVSKKMPQNSAYRSGHMVKCRNAGGPSNYRMGGDRQKKSTGGPVSSRGQGIVMASKRR